MTVLKWLLIVVSTGYAGGLVVLFFAQRSFLFPIPTIERTAPRRRRLSAKPKNMC